MTTRPINFGQVTGRRLARMVGETSGEGRSRRNDIRTSTIHLCRLLEHLPPSNIAQEDAFYDTVGIKFDELANTDSGVLTDQQIEDQLLAYMQEVETTISGTPTSARALYADYNPVTQTFAYVGGMIRVWNLWPQWLYDGYRYAVDFNGTILNDATFGGQISGNVGWGWLAIERGPGGLWWASCPRKQALVTEGTTFLTAADII